MTLDVLSDHSLILWYSMASSSGVKFCLLCSNAVVWCCRNSAVLYV